MTRAVESHEGCEESIIDPIILAAIDTAHHDDDDDDGR